MAFGLGVLRLSPDAFWAMSLREVMAAMDGAGIGAGASSVKAPDQADLARLMAQFPDR